MRRVLDALLMRQNVELKPEVQSGLERLFRKELHKVLQKPPVYDYYEVSGVHPNGSVYNQGDYKERNADDPYQTFVRHMCEYIFLQDERFDATTYPGADAPWRILLNSDTPGAQAYFGAMKKASQDKVFQNTARTLRNLIQKEYKKIRNQLHKDNFDYRHIQNAIESIIEILHMISRGEGERLPIVLGSWAEKYPDKGTLRIVN